MLRRVREPARGSQGLGSLGGVTRHFLLITAVNFLGHDRDHQVGRWAQDSINLPFRNSLSELGLMYQTACYTVPGKS